MAGPWPWNLVVALSAVAAGLCCFAGRGLRLHGIAVLLGAAAWFLYWRALVPWETATTPRSSFDDNTTGIGLAVSTDCGAVVLGGYQALLCLALLLQVIRQARRRPGRSLRGIRDA
jgi:hypothetical protein